MSPPIGETKGPFVFLGTATWVNASHVTCIAGTADPNKCWVTVVPAGTDDNGSYPVDASPDTILNAVVGALVYWDRTRGQEREQGRMDTAIRRQPER